MFAKVLQAQASVPCLQEQAAPSTLSTPIVVAWPASHAPAPSLLWIGLLWLKERRHVEGWQAKYAGALLHGHRAGPAQCLSVSRLLARTPELLVAVQPACLAVSCLCVLSRASCSTAAAQTSIPASAQRVRVLHLII